jgi:5-methylcytosine-specific restriction endonuclease McrA
MTKDTLVLDNSMIPINFTSSSRAIKMLYTNKADIIYSDDSELFRSEKFDIGMPRVIRLKNKFAMKCRRKIPFSRRNVVTRDSVNGKAQCQYCLKLLNLKDITFDHVHPKSKGGESSFRNLVIACIECNKKKDDMTTEESGMFPFRKPIEPSIQDKRFEFRLKINKIVKEWEAWENYLYWSVELEK